MSENEKVTISLSIDEADIVVSALEDDIEDHHSYDHVAPIVRLVDKIQVQVAGIRLEEKRKQLEEEIKRLGNAPVV